MAASESLDLFELVDLLSCSDSDLHSEQILPILFGAKARGHLTLSWRAASAASMGSDWSDAVLESSSFSLSGVLFDCLDDLGAAALA